MDVDCSMWVFYGGVKDLNGIVMCGFFDIFGWEKMVFMDVV